MLKLTTIFFVLCLSVLAVVHYVSLQFFLYWRFPLIDIPVHFFGGAVVALGVFTTQDFIRRVPDRFLYFWPVMSMVVIVVLLWEIFELSIGVPATEPGYSIDTALDIIVGVAGGLVGFLLGHTLRRL